MSSILEELSQTANVTIAPEIKVADDDYLTNYVANQKKRIADDAVWLALTCTLFGFLFFPLILAAVSLGLLASTFSQRKRPSGLAIKFGVSTAIANVSLIAIRLIY